MTEIEFERELQSFHPHAMFAWIRDVGAVLAGDNVKIVRYEASSVAAAPGGGSIVGHVMSLPPDGTPGVAYKARIDSEGLISWSDVSTPVDNKLQTKGGKEVGFKTTVQLVQLPRMVGYRERTAERARDRELAEAAPAQAPWVAPLEGASTLPPLEADDMAAALAAMGMPPAAVAEAVEEIGVLAAPAVVPADPSVALMVALVPDRAAFARVLLALWNRSQELDLPRPDFTHWDGTTKDLLIALGLDYDDDANEYVIKSK